LFIISCEPINVEVSNNAENIENTDNTTNNEDDDNLNGGLEDPIENPEMDW
jgi:hypothetical protein